MIGHIKTRRQIKGESVYILYQILQTMKIQIKVNGDLNKDIQAFFKENESQNHEIQT